MFGKKGWKSSKKIFAHRIAVIIETYDDFPSSQANHAVPRGHRSGRHIVDQEPASMKILLDHLDGVIRATVRCNQNFVRTAF